MTNYFPPEARGRTVADLSNPYEDWISQAESALDAIEREGLLLDGVERRVVKTLVKRARFLVDRQATAPLRDLSFDRREVDALIEVLDVYVDLDPADGPE